MLRHKRHKITPTIEKPNKCTDCGKAFSRLADLTRHKRIHTGEKPFECTDCGKAFGHRANLTRHKIIHTGLKPYECTDCAKAFRRLADLTRHKRIHTGEKPFECTDCGKAFRHHVNLTRHKVIHTGLRPYECTDCGKTFRFLSNLRTHKSTHTGEKPYECSDCGKAFRLFVYLTTHKRIHTGGKSFECTDCGKAFRQPSHLKRHKGIQCNSCGKAFNQLASFTKHTRFQIGEKPFTCKECGKMLNSFEDLTMHMLNHTDKRPHNCTECGKSFRKYVDLTTHLRTHVTVKTYDSRKPIRCNSPSVQRQNQLTIKHRAKLAVQQGGVISKQRNLRDRHSRLKMTAISNRDKVLQQKGSQKKRSVGMKPSPCTSLDETTTKRGILNRNISVRKNLHDCGQCGKTFTNHASMDKHKKLHVLGREYKCLSCGEFLTTTHEQKTNTCLCQGCENTFPKTIVVVNREEPVMLGKQSRIRKRSVKFDEFIDGSLSTSKAVVKDLKSFEENKVSNTGLLCDYCTLSFADEDKFKKHTVAHLQQFPYKCNVCRRSFNHILHLQKHVSNHK